MKNLSMLVIELDLLRLDGADDAGDWEGRLRCEKRSAASRQEGGDEQDGGRA